VAADARPSLVVCSAADARRFESSGMVAPPLALDSLTRPGPASEAVATRPPRAASETALLSYTSGTFAAPKAVRTTFDNLTFEAFALSRALACNVDDVFLSILPLHHLLEFSGGLLALLVSGTHVRYLPSLLPHEILAALGATRATRAVVVPLVLRLLLRAIDHDPTLLDGVARTRGGAFRHFICGGAALHADVEDAFERLDMPVLQGYGLTEASPVVTTNTPSAQRPHTVGRALHGVEVRIAPCGEILTRGPHVSPGYVHDAAGALTIDDDGWLHTGDLGRLDDDGFLTITGRSSDRIVLASGRNVQPEAVEAALSRVAEVGEVCVVAVAAEAGPLAGSPRVCAVVVPAVGVDDDDVRAAVARAAGRLEPHERPALVLLQREPLPRAATGKVLRRHVAVLAASSTHGGGGVASTS
jgi:long-chain acyl-CoA synthetase